MLEQEKLCLRPWTAPERREVMDPDTGTLLGLARWRPTCESDWWSWLAGRTLSIHEAGDEPLLCTVQHGWRLGSFWEVRDADGRIVASLHRRRIWDRAGRELAVRHRAGNVSLIWLRRWDSQILATLTGTDEGSLLHFGADVAEKPFAKMALLAAALTVEE